MRLFNSITKDCWFCGLSAALFLFCSALNSVYVHGYLPPKNIRFTVTKKHWVTSFISWFFGSSTKPKFPTIGISKIPLTNYHTVSYSGVSDSKLQVWLTVFYTWLCCVSRRTCRKYKTKISNHWPKSKLLWRFRNSAYHTVSCSGVSDSKLQVWLIVFYTWFCLP